MPTRNKRLAKKHTKKATHYRLFKDPKKNCGVCVYMNKDGTCRKVNGQVDRLHVCDLFRKAP